MNKIVLSLALVALGFGAFAQNKQAKSVPPKASAASGFKSLPLGADIPMSRHGMMSTGGKHVRLEQLKTNNGLVVMFSCNTCPYVVKAQARTREAMDQANNMNIGMVVINSNEALREADDALMHMRVYAEAQQYRFPYVVDEQSQLANAFGATRTPEVFLFNAKGKLVYKGALEDSPGEPEKSQHGYLVEAMQAMIAGKPIKPAETKSIGCSIKRVSN